MTAQTVETASPRQQTGSKRQADTLWRRSLRRFLRHRAAVGALLFLAFLLVCAVAPGLIAPYDSLAIDRKLRLQPPSQAHWFGTDDFGRDILSRLVYGARISLQVGIVAVAIAAIFGIMTGVLAGYFGSFVDGGLMLLMDILFAFRRSCWPSPSWRSWARRR